MKPTVVLLHGLGRSHRSLGGLERFIARLGYETWSRSYPSRRSSIAELAATVAGRIRIEVGDRPVIGVSHSMGGILARHMADALDWRGLVMLAPPNQGSRVAAALGGNPMFRWLFGPAGVELGAALRAEPWPPPPLPFAVIAGTVGPSLGNAPSWLVGALGLMPSGEPHDGTVTVAETRLPGMGDFAEVPASHTWLMNHPATRELVRRFLAHGDFSERPPAG
jgi:triacylglycerol lipase